MACALLSERHIYLGAPVSLTPPLQTCFRSFSFFRRGVLDDNHFPVFKHALERQANHFHVFQNRCHTDLVVSRASNAGNMRLLAVYGSGMTTWEIPALSIFPSKRRQRPTHELNIYHKRYSSLQKNSLKYTSLSSNELIYAPLLPNSHFPSSHILLLLEQASTESATHSITPSPTLRLPGREPKAGKEKNGTLTVTPLNDSG